MEFLIFTCAVQTAGAPFVTAVECVGHAEDDREAAGGVSLSRASTANESAAAASTTTSLTELEPMSMAASFIC